MFYHLQYIHLFRPFLKYTPSSSPLPAHVSPRRICTSNAGAISKLMRLYKKQYNLRQICNIAVYMVHSACTIHMLNLPEKTAKRDIIHGVKHLEEIAEDWLCARRTLCILSVLARKWGVEMPEEASVVLQRTDEKYGSFSTSDVPSPNRSGASNVATTPSPPSYSGSPPPPGKQEQQQFSPYSQYSHPTPPQMPLDVPVTSMASDILGALALSAPPSQNIPPQLADSQLPHHMASGPPMTMGDALTAASAWTSMPAVTTQSIGGYGQPSFSPTQVGLPQQQQQQQQPPIQQRQGQQPADGRPRHVSPQSSAVYAIDGQEWFLKDGVNWQQNFEAWGSGAAAGGGGSNIPTSPSMFMFQGLRGGGSNGDMDTGGFDAFGSMGNIDHLPGLD